MSETPENGAESSENSERTEAPLDFDPYRFGAPEHPVPPEFAPPGYKPPVAVKPPPDPFGKTVLDERPLKVMIMVEVIKCR